MSVEKKIPEQHYSSLYTKKISVIDDLFIIEGDPNKEIYTIPLLSIFNNSYIEQFEIEKNSLAKPEKTFESKSETVSSNLEIKNQLNSIPLNDQMTNIQNIKKIARTIEDHINILYNEKIEKVKKEHLNHDLELEIENIEILRSRTLEKIRNKSNNNKEQDINAIYDAKIEKIMSFTPSPERENFLETIEKKRKQALELLKKDSPKTKSDFINLIYEIRSNKVKESSLPTPDLKRQLVKIEIQRLKALRSLQEEKEKMTIA